MHSVSVAMAKNCQNAVQMSFFPNFMPVGLFAPQCCLLQEVLLSLPNSALPVIYELWSCEQWLVGLLLVALPAFQARPSRNLWNSSCFICRGNCCVVWHRHKLHTSFKAELELQGVKEKAAFCILFCQNLKGHSESLKRPQFIRANYGSLDILYCLSVI